MVLRYRRKDGTQTEFELGDRPITIGRSPEADLVILDDKASRLHCGIRVWDGDFILKDLKSKNGTFVNGQRIEMVKLELGDQVRVGSCVFSFEMDPGKGTQTILREVADEMAGGKGYSTMLKEIVGDSEGVEDVEEVEAVATLDEAIAVEEVEPEPAPAPKRETEITPPPASGAPTLPATPRRVVKIRMRSPDKK